MLGIKRRAEKGRRNDKADDNEGTCARFDDVGPHEGFGLTRRSLKYMSIEILQHGGQRLKTNINLLKYSSPGSG